MAKKTKRAARGSLKKSLRHLEKRVSRRKALKLDRNTPSKPDAVAQAIAARMVTPKGLPPRPVNTRWPVEIKIGKRHRKDFGEIEGLALSFNERGTIIQPIAITTNDELIAGERRMKAWVHPVSKFRTDPIPVHIITIDNIVAGEWDENAHRKDFTPTEAVAIKKEIEKLLEQHARARQAHGSTAPGRKGAKTGDKPIRAGERASAMTGRKRRTMEKAEAVVDAATKDPVRFGKLQEDMDRTGKVDGPFKRLTVMKAKDAMNEAPPRLPMNGPYTTLSIDCPWPAEIEKDQEAIDAAGRSFRPYPEMSIKSLCQFMREQVRPIMADDCSVWFHVPNHHLVSGHAHHVMAALGFNVALIGDKAHEDALAALASEASGQRGKADRGKPVTMLTWDKVLLGRGQVLRDQTEQVVLLVRGKPVIDVFGENPPTTLLSAKRRDNSQKPAEFYRLVERVTPAKRYAAIFSTGGEGELWDSHGDQVGKHAPLAPTIFEQLEAKQEMAAAAERGWISHAKNRKAKLTEAGEIRLGAMKIRFREGVPLEQQVTQLGGIGNVVDVPAAETARVEDDGPELPFAQPACRVCGCTDDRKCPGGCAMVERTLCSKCIASQGHVVNMHGGPVIEAGEVVGGERKATCSCGVLNYSGPWSDPAACEKQVRAHWQQVVAEETGIPPDLRRGDRQPAQAPQ